MKEFKVYSYSTDQKLGTFLSITDGPAGVQVWYNDEKNDLIKSAYRENIYLKKKKKYISDCPR